MKIKMLFSAILLFSVISMAQDKPVKLLKVPEVKIIKYDTTMYIKPCGGFETALVAAFTAKKVPVEIKTSPEGADYTIECSSVTGKEPTFAQTWILKKYQANEDASVRIVDKDGFVAWAYSAHKYSAVHGKQSTAEAIAKHLKEEIEGKSKVM